MVAGDQVVGDPEVPSDLGHTVLANGIAQASDAAMLTVGAIVAGKLGEVWGLRL